MQYRSFKSVAAILLVITVLPLVIVTLVAMLLAAFPNLFRLSVIRFVSWECGRSIDVRGALRVRLLTRSPQIEAEQVTISNPPWTKPGITGDITKLTMAFAPLLSRQSGLSLLKLDGAVLHFTRDSAGHANWQRVDPDKSPGSPLPMIRALELGQAHVTLADERLHLFYDGELSILGSNSGQPLEMKGSGTLNQRSVIFRLKGDPLSNAAPDRAYAFEFNERSSGTELTAQGRLPKPFDLDIVDAEFDAGGVDLRDLYYLVGVSLPNTGTFQLHGRMERRDGKTLFDDLKVVSGQSDMRGRVSLETQNDRRTLVNIDLRSALLRLADVGLRAAGRDPHPDAPPRLFSDVQLVTPATRRVDAIGKFSAEHLLLSRVEVTELSAPFRIDGGFVKAPNITGKFLGGKFFLHVNANANQRPALSRIELALTGLQLAQIPHKAQAPPYEGSLSMQLQAQGRGDSLHAMAADADGKVRAWVLQGRLRASLAELAGVDFRGLGLTLTRNGHDVGVACAGADFQIHSGVMQATRLFIDSEPVFISGDGRILLDPETIELELHGEPKRLRILRVKAPVLVRGTLMQPRFSVGAAQGSLQLVDPGKAHDADCAALQAH